MGKTEYLNLSTYTNVHRAQIFYMYKCKSNIFEVLI